MLHNIMVSMAAVTASKKVYTYKGNFIPLD